MPELPEVEVVRGGIEPAVVGASVAGVEVFDERSLKRHDRTRGSFVDLLEGQRMLGAVRRGKFLWIPLSSGNALVTHLGMSGQVLLRAPGAEAEKQLRIRIHLDQPAFGEVWLNFVDQRIFGSMAIDSMAPTADGEVAGYSGVAQTGGGAALLPTWAYSLPSQVAHIARDPLDPAFSDASFADALTRKNSGIKRVLLDQSMISGIGNIYADEALFAARLHYDQPANSLSASEVSTVLSAVRLILNKALAEGGTSFDAQYVNVNGESGYFSHSLTAYGQHGKPCQRCGTVMVREQFMNRGSHFCPSCQQKRVQVRD